MQTCKSTILFSFFLAVALSFPSSSRAALNAYMTVTGATQGMIEGGATQAGREGMIEVVSFGHNVSTPRDPASGLPTGKRQHKPIRILKAIDKSTPLLFKALVDNENLTEVIIRFYRSDGSGKEVNFYTVELQNASIVSVMPIHSSADAGSIKVPMRESISMTYQKIIVTYEDGGITAEDDWETPLP